MGIITAFMLGGAVLPGAGSSSRQPNQASVAATESDQSPQVMGAATSSPDTSQDQLKVKVTEERTEESVPYATQQINDSNLAAGTKETRTPGRNGIKVKTYQVTYTDGKETDRLLIRDELAQAPVTQIVAVGTKKAAPAAQLQPQPQSASNAGAGCDPNYSGACVPIASDVDCAGGSGNGPAYVRGPVTVIGSDIYDLDRDGDGIGCE